MSKPLAIDLFCGSFQPKLALSAYPPIKQLVTGWAQYPDHMSLGIVRETPSPVSLEVWLVGDFQNTAFSAGFARFRHIRIPGFQAIESVVGEFPFRLINRAARLVLSARPCFPQFSGRCDGAVRGAISFVGIGRLYREVNSATSTVSACFGRTFMLLTTNSARTLSAVIAAPFFVGSDGLKWFETLPARQIIHTLEIAS